MFVKTTYIYNNIKMLNNYVVGRHAYRIMNMIMLSSLNKLMTFYHEKRVQPC